MSANTVGHTIAFGVLADLSSTSIVGQVLRSVLNAGSSMVTGITPRKGGYDLENEKGQYRQLEVVHNNALLKAEFHRKIKDTTMWRYCVFCGEKIERGA